jgi:chromate transporter
MEPRPASEAPRPGIRAALEVLLVTTRLGVTSFGGPIAHLGYFRDEYVRRRKWLDEATYADLIALCQLLPGPASSELGIAIGILRARLLGGFAAWLGFTLPSAIMLTAFAFAVQALGSGDLPYLHGLQVVAVVVVANAVWSMGKTLTPDRPRLLVALGGAVLATGLPAGWGQVSAILLGAVAGVVFFRGTGQPDADPGDRLHVEVPIRRVAGAIVLGAFGVLLVGLTVLRQLVVSRPLAVFQSFFVVASFVFGGGHVVLPLLQAQVVPPGWVSESQFLAGYGAAQAVPGPLFTFGAYLGYIAAGGVPGAALGLVAIFAPSFFLVIGTLPFWDAMRRRTGFRSVLTGVNASVVGLLAAALYNPVWVSTVKGPSDFLLVLVGFAIVFVLRAPPWVAVIILGVLGAVFHGLSLLHL